MIFISRSDLVLPLMPRIAVGCAERYATSPKPSSFAISSVASKKSHLGVIGYGPIESCLHDRLGAYHRAAVHGAVLQRHEGRFITAIYCIFVLAKERLLFRC